MTVLLEYSEDLFDRTTIARCCSPKAWADGRLALLVSREP
jgi:hypothetical protein